jgi:hypothetical protein
VHNPIRPVGGDFAKNADLTSPLRSSGRDDQNAYIERPIWSSDERVMTSRKLDPDQTSWLGWSDQF